MKKEQIDQLYHLLRVVSNEELDYRLGFSPQHCTLGLARHLLGGGDYLALVQYSSYYGERFLVQPTYEAIKEKEWQPGRIVEFGAGLGWLGRGLAAKFGLLPTLFVDKRPWTLTDIVANLETNEGREVVRKRMTKNDLVVMADLLHCVENPGLIISHFSEWPIAALEYCPDNQEWRDSYSVQISRHGANPIEPDMLADVFCDRELDAIELNPYILFLAEAKK